MRADYGRSSAHFRRLTLNLRRQRRPCALALPGCLGIDYAAPPRSPTSFTADHILPRDLYPELAEVLGNLQPACWHCNAAKGKGISAKPSLGVTSARW